ncbi:hypothetical protein D3C87_1628890 [compost metagenome]
MFGRQAPLDGGHFMKRTITAAAVGLLCLAIGSGAALAQDDENQILDDAMAFAMHDAAFTIYHEVGHMLVGELGLPVLGKEEDAVDTLATIWLLNDEDQDYAFNALIDASDGWYFNAVNSTGRVSTSFPIMTSIAWISSAPMPWSA